MLDVPAVTAWVQLVIAALGLAAALLAWDNRRELRRHVNGSTERSKRGCLAIRGLTECIRSLKSKRNGCRG